MSGLPLNSVCARRAAAVVSVLIAAPAAGQACFPVFTDQTQAAGLAATFSPSSWLFVTEINVAAMLGGGAVGDFDDDGDPDVFVLMGGGAPDRLFVNNGDGTFSEQAAAWGVAYAHMGVGAAVGDYDGDGTLDLYVMSLGPATAPPVPAAHRLYRNNGDGTFTDVAVEAGVDQTSAEIPDGFGAAFGDIDLDGDLDLATSGWVYESGANRLFRNNGDGTFTDVTAEALLPDIDVCRGFTPELVDMNGDRYPELLLAADFGTSRYYANNGDGTFTDLTADNGTGLDGNGMGSAVGDVNGDGRPDWYVTSIYSPQSYLPGVPGTGNMLYLNAGDHQYFEIGEAMGVRDGGWGWGTVAADVDNDGLLDLVETNGWTQPNGPAGPEWQNEQSYVFRNIGNGFVDVAAPAGLIHEGLGRGLSDLDYDGDGDRDILIFAHDVPLKLYRNELDAACNWLRVALDTAAAPGLAPDGFGATVTVSAGGLTQWRFVHGGGSYLVGNEPSAHFGLGAETLVDEVVVTWPDGTVTQRENVAANQVLELSPCPADLDGDGTVGVTDFLALLAQWGACSGCAADFDGDGAVGVTDFLALLASWGGCP